MGIVPADPSSPMAVEVLREYYGDIVGRFHGRAATSAEVDAAMLDEPNTDLTGDSGAFAVFSTDGRAVGCGGLRFIDPDTAELTRLFVSPPARGLGIGSAIVLHLEGIAWNSGRCVVRLDTRSDLIEARRLYLSLGYTETDAFNNDPHAESWFSKKLSHDNC